MKEKFIVTGMTCSACSSRVEKVVSKLNGTNDTMVNLLTGTMQVNYDEEKINTQEIIRTVEKAGYGAYSVSNNQAQGQNPNRNLSPTASQSQVQAQAQGQNPNRNLSPTASQSQVQVQAQVQPQGVNAQSTSPTDMRLSEDKKMKRRLIWSVAFLIPLMIIAMGHMVGGSDNILHEYSMNRPLTMVLIQVVFLVPIVILNRKYFIVGFPTLFRGHPNMDSLIAVGATAAMVYGAFAIFRMTAGYETGNMELVHTYGKDIYLESAATILTLITVGKYLETRSKGKTSQAIEKLMNLAPKTATIEIDGEEIQVLTSQLQIGDVLVVRPGEAIAADGIIISGNTSIDEAAITGESIPVEKQPGDKAISATINKAGFIKVKCEKVGEDSTINQIIRLVDEASASKAPIARLADKIAGVFVPIVMSIALIASLIWLITGATFEFALSIGISILVISCPCALGLATPVAIMVGTGKGAENGILIKSGQALETAHKIDTVVMDKTGTITEGKPKVTDIEPLTTSKAHLLTIAAALEAKSEHPLADAIVSYAKDLNLEKEEVENFQAVFGRGVKGAFGGKEYIAGNLAMIREWGLNIDQIIEKINKYAKEGKTPLIFADKESIIGIISVADTEKENSKKAIEELAKMKIEVVMLTGDNKITGEAIGKRLNINKVISEVMPADKEKHIARLMSEGHTVAMIGDGINDAPALARADVGIAIGAGTDVAIESADAVLMRNDLLDAVSAIKLSKAVIRNIKENLFWAFFYNSIGIPLAAGLLYPEFGLKLSPMFGAFAMSLSSICVVLNALRLKLFKTETKIEKKEKIMEKYQLKIEGMMCSHCENHVSDALNKMEGVKAVVNVETGLAEITAEKIMSKEAFEKVIEEAGYKLVEMK